MPIVPCAQLTTGQPPFGALPFGIATVPEIDRAVAVGRGRAVQQQRVALRALEHRRAGQLALPDRRPVRAARAGSRAACRRRSPGGPFWTVAALAGAAAARTSAAGEEKARHPAHVNAGVNERTAASSGSWPLNRSNLARDRVLGEQALVEDRGDVVPRSRRRNRPARGRRARCPARSSARPVERSSTPARWPPTRGRRRAWPRSTGCIGPGRVGQLACRSRRRSGSGRRRAPARPRCTSRAPPRSSVCLRSAPLPGPAPAANTIASAPPMCGRTSSCSRSHSTGWAPSASRSATWSGLRISPRGVWPRWASNLRRRRAICPWPPATRTSIPRGYETGGASAPR